MVGARKLELLSFRNVAQLDNIVNGSGLEDFVKK